uniref:G-protein coupled receptors family 1 profile domain-containing protein n=1 Tax=Plectus sambesii TaxID=2011161 RepID=A0A914XER9_9BILA
MSASWTHAERIPASVLHFLLGVVIFVANLTLLVAVLSERKLRTGAYYLAANLWFANCLLGAAMAVENVVGVNIEHGNKPLATTEGTAALLNCLVTLATLLALSTARLVWHRSPQHSMSAWSALKISLSMWAAIGILVLVKTIAFAVFNASTDNDQSVCYRCLFGFETAILVIFVIANVLIYAVTLYMIVSRVGSTVHDSRRPVANIKEARDAITTGLWLLLHLISFALLAMLLVAETFWSTQARPEGPTVHLLLAAFSLHALANPLVAVLRDVDVAASVRRAISCDQVRASPTTTTTGTLSVGPMMSIDDPPPPYMSRMNSASNSLLDQQ